MKYPTSVFLILNNEFCERFAYHTVHTTLSLYLVDILDFSEDTAVVIFHAYTMFVYFFPLMGAIIADSWLGSYRTILYLGILYTFGQYLLMMASIPWFHLPVREISLLGLFLLSIGVGGIKPCIVPLASDQFNQSEEKDKIPGFITSIFTTIAIASVLSTFISPMLRKDVTCFGLNTCYPLTFLVPTMLMTLVVAIHFLGRPLYKKTKPNGNITLKVCKCIIYAIVRKLKSKEKRTHWIDHADYKYDLQLIEDVKTVLRFGKLYFLTVGFYCVNYQSSSRWIFQASHMNGEFFGYLIKPDQFQTIGSFLFLIFIPTCQYIIYPIVAKIFLINTPLRKINTGLMLAATSFVISGILEFSLESTYRVQPYPGLAHIRVFNTMNCPVNLSLEGQMHELEALGLYQNVNIPVIENTSLKLDVEIKCPNSVPSKFTGSIRAEEKKALTYLLNHDSLQFGLVDEIEKSKTGDPTIRALILTDSGVPANLSLSIEGKNCYRLNMMEDKLFTEFIEVIHDTYNIIIDDVQMERDVSLSSGGTYTIVGQITSDKKVIKTVTIHQPNSIHIFWQLPQYIIFSLADVFVSTSGLHFALSQAPASMKSTVMSEVFLSQALANLIVIVIKKVDFFERKVFEYFLYAGLVYLDMLIFGVMAMSYKYVDSQTSEENSSAIK